MIDPCGISVYDWFFLDPEEDAAQSASDNPDFLKALEGCTILTSENPLWDDEVDTNAQKADGDAEAREKEKKAAGLADARTHAATLAGAKPVLPEDDPT